MKFLRFPLCILLALVSVRSADAQWFSSAPRKGALYALWGWNTASYTNSDIHFSGGNYDFTLLDVPAHDRPTPFSAKDYFALTRVTIPQTNMRVGYFVNDHLSISVGVDHMKYVMDNNVWVGFEGFIGDTIYSEQVINDQAFLGYNFLTYEHTDGLNYINSEIEYFFQLFHSRSFQWNMLAGAGIGMVMPKSNVKLMGFAQNDQFHISGYGTDVKVGMELIFFRYFVLKGEMKKGYINLPDVVTTGRDLKDRADQQFFFNQVNFMFGVNFPLDRTRGNVPDEAEDRRS